MQPYLQEGKSAKWSALAWTIWLLAASFFFYKNMLMVSPSVMRKELMSEFALSAASFGNLAACYFYAYTVMQIPVGILLDRYSIRYIATIAIFLCAAGTYLFAQANSLLLAEVARALIGLGGAFAPVACFKLIATWFPAKRFASIAGLSLTAGMIGGVVGSAPVSLLVGTQGWRNSMLTLAIPAIVLAVLFWSLVRDHPKKSTVTHQKNGLFHGLITVLNDRETWLLSFYSGLAYAPATVFGGVWGVSFLEQAYHLPNSVAAMNTSLIFVGFAIGCPLAGLLSDFIGRRKLVIAIGTSLAISAISAVIYVPNLPIFIVGTLLFAFGVGIGSYFLCFSMVRESHSFAVAATALGFMNTFDSLWEAFTQPLIGMLLDLQWNGNAIEGVRIFSANAYRFSLSILPLYLAIALTLLFFIKETFCQQKH